MEFEVFDIGLTEYRRARRFQQEIFSGVKSGRLGSALILCRHYPVVTLGRLTGKGSLKVPYGELARNGIQAYEVERGGGVTYHGPGQLIVYPICNLEYFKKDLHWYLRALEEAVMGCLAVFGIEAQRRQELTGVWIGNKKISSIGIAISRWVTFHGLSLNIKKDDLHTFSLIRPCGMDIEMTSMETVLQESVDADMVKQTFVQNFRDVFLAEEEKAPILARR